MSTNHYDPRQTFICRLATCLRKLLTKTLPRAIDWTVCLTWARNFKKLDPGFFWLLIPLHQNSFTTILISTLAPTNFKTIDLGSNLVPLHQTKLPETLNVVLILVPLHQNKTSGNFEFGFNWFGALAPTQTSRNPSWFWIGLVPLHQTITLWNLLLIKIDLVPLHQPKTSWTRELVKLIWCPCAKSTEPFVSPLH